MGISLCANIQSMINVYVPEVTLEEQAAIAEIGRASQTACNLPVLLHDLHHLTHGCEENTTVKT